MKAELKNAVRKQMIQNGSKTDHLEHIGSLGPEIVQNDAKQTVWTPSTNPSEGYVSFNQPFRGLCESGGPGPKTKNVLRKTDTRSPDAWACAHALRSPRAVGLKGDELACSEA